MENIFISDYFDLENYSRASDLYQKALSYNKNSKNATINLIMAYQNNKKYDDAEKLIISKYEEKTEQVPCSSIPYISF